LRSEASSQLPTSLARSSLHPRSQPEENFAETEKENARMGVEEAGVRTVAEVKLVKGAILDLSRSCTSETWGHVHLALTSFLHRVGSADSDHDGYCTICEDARWDTRFSCGHGYCCEQCAHGLVKVRWNGERSYARIINYNKL